MNTTELTQALAPYQGRSGFLGSVADQLTRRGSLSPKQIEAVTRILAERATEQEANPDATADGGQSLTPGVYRKGGAVYVVKPTRKDPVTGGTHLYAKQLQEIGGHRLRDEDGETVQYEMVYAPGMIRHLAEADRLPLEDAKALAIRYGRCINCGRALKDAKSVEQGIGPVCIKMFAARPLASA